VSAPYNAFSVCMLHGTEVYASVIWSYVSKHLPFIKVVEHLGGNVVSKPENVISSN
jgi:hypothetical protein